MGAFDPPWYVPTQNAPQCSNPPSNPTCTIFATGLATDGSNWMTGECVDTDFTQLPPVTTDITPGQDGTVLFDGEFPSCLSNSPPEFDLADGLWWIHNRGPGGDENPPRWTNFNIGVSYWTPDHTFLGYGPNGSFAPPYPEAPHVLCQTRGQYVATTDNPIVVRVSGQTEYTTWPVEWAGAVFTNIYCQIQPVPPVIDMADTESVLYLAMIDGSAWAFSNGGRVQLAADPDGRQMAGGMVAVATAADAAFYCDWHGQLWATGTVYTMNDVTGEWSQQTITGYVVKVPIKASNITLMGPHGIGPYGQNNVALWVNGGNQLIGLGSHEDAELLNGLLPSYPNPITQPVQGAYTWKTPDPDPNNPYNPPVRPVTTFDYRSYIWKALATSNYAAYGYFGAKTGGPIRPQGHMIG